ncbi:hypothetical protein SPHV1_470010 [Novosphingobium sp. KN65.2]|nr:hypothetical protein SPHV1_470010 [Novosphingobium sp. KN65.2]
MTIHHSAARNSAFYFAMFKSVHKFVEMQERNFSEYRLLCLQVVVTSPCKTRRVATTSVMRALS